MNARKKGKNYELVLLQELRNWYPEVMTSRNASKVTDDKKVDFVNTGEYAIQAKATERTPPYQDIIAEIEKNFKGKKAVVIHRRKYKKDVAVISKYNFYLMLQELIKLREIKQIYDELELEND